jgi:hypothetical protein
MTTPAVGAARIERMVQPALRHDTASRESGFTMVTAVGWVLVLASMFWSRLFMLGFFIFSHNIDRAFGTVILPVLGFFVLPWTTVTYAAMWGISSDRVSGIEWLFVGIALILDLYTWSGLGRLRR